MAFVIECCSKNGALVVLHLKKGRGSERTNAEKSLYYTWPIAILHHTANTLNSNVVFQKIPAAVSWDSRSLPNLLLNPTTSNFWSEMDLR